MARVLITGGAGFIGCNFARHVDRAHPDWEIVVLDKLTYAGRRENLADLERRLAGFRFVHGDICDRDVVAQAMAGCHYVVNFAAETHVDRSLYEAGGFIQCGGFLVVNSITQDTQGRACRAEIPGGSMRRE